MNLISKLNTSTGESSRLIRNEEKKRFQWTVNVRSEFGDYRADELQVQLASDHIVLVGLQQKWRPLTEGQARRSFEARQSLDFPLDERSMLAKETEDGSVCIQATGSGLLQQLLSSDKSPKKPAIVFNVTPFAVPISNTEKLLRTLMGKSEPDVLLPEMASKLTITPSALPANPICLVSSTTPSSVTKTNSVSAAKSKRVSVDDLLSSSLPKPAIQPSTNETADKPSSPLLNKLLHAVRNKDSVYHQDPEIKELLQCRKQKGPSPTPVN